MRIFVQRTNTVRAPVLAKPISKEETRRNEAEYVHLRLKSYSLGMRIFVLSWVLALADGESPHALKKEDQGACEYPDEVELRWGGRTEEGLTWNFMPPADTAAMIRLWFDRSDTQVFEVQN